MPVFSDKEQEYLCMNEFTDFHDIHSELVNKINARDDQRNGSKENNLKVRPKYEIEHLYVDFRNMIISEKIRAISKLSLREPSVKKITKLCLPKFDSNFYSSWIASAGSKDLSLYSQPSI